MPAEGGPRGSREMVAIRGRTAQVVYCSDSAIPAGRFERTSPRGDLLVRTGRWNAVVRRVPRAAIVSRDGEDIKLKLTRAQLEGSPVYLPDGEVELAVRDSFRRYPPLANYGTGSIQVAVEDGV